MELLPIGIQFIDMVNSNMGSILKEIKRKFKSEDSADVQWVVNATMVTMIVTIVVLVAFFLYINYRNV
jgi:hypothetical protein